jgi:hypothetical protein
VNGAGEFGAVKEAAGIAIISTPITVSRQTKLNPVKIQQIERVT